MVLDKYPAIAPYVFVTPTATMLIRPGRRVDANGRIYLSYLSEWKKGRSDLKGLVDILHREIRHDNFRTLKYT